ncbi:MAG: phosphoglycerate kinase, partial [Spirochaetaceae bacterium]|nr:phosphoglycerate kinase [Spirochaetaceae bacterium]
MRFGINTLDDVAVYNKTVLCRVDINQPVDKATGVLKDTSRIEACVPTIRELSDKGAKLVLLAHQGSDIEYKNFYTTEPHAKALECFLGREVRFIDDVCGPAARGAIKTLQSGEILLLDNVRFVSEEQTLFETRLLLSHEEQAKTL